MFGDQKSLNSLNKVIKFSKINKNNKFKLIYCPPYTLLDLFYKKLKNTNIDVGAQNCHENESYGAYTGSINSIMLKIDSFTKFFNGLVVLSLGSKIFLPLN